MKQMLKNQAKRSGIALAAVAAFAAFGTATAQAQEFASADITLLTNGESAGSLNCSFRETGLTPGSFVRYDCSSQYVGVVAGCVYKGKLVGNTRNYIYNNIHPEEVENLLVKNNGGSLRGDIVTLIPEPGEANALICTAPAEVADIAVRWCNNTLTDVTNNIIGANVPELFAQLVKVPGSVPDCATLANGPFTPPGE